MVDVKESKKNIAKSEKRLLNADIALSAQICFPKCRSLLHCCSSGAPVHICAVVQIVHEQLCALCAAAILVQISAGHRLHCSEMFIIAVDCRWSSL